MNKKANMKTTLGLSAFFCPIFPVYHVVKSYTRSNWSGDWRASINVALLAIPQGMAYALVAGLPIQYGLLGSAFAAILGGLLGKDRFITLGPTNATAVLLFGVFAGLGMIKANGMGTDSALMLLPWILACSGVFLLVASFLRISFMVQFVSRTVITAYVTAAAFLIIVNQSKHILGLSGQGEGTPSTFWGILFQTLDDIGQASGPSIWLGLITAIIFLILQLKLRALPNVALTLIIASLVGMLFERFQWKVSYLDSFESTRSFLVVPSLHAFGSHWETILWSASAVSLLCLLEGLSIGKSLSARAGARIDSNQETFSIGISNLGCSVLSGMPASGSLTRSSLNVQSGAKTGVSNLLAGMLILLGYFLLGDLVAYVPLPSLAALVIFIGASLVKARQIKTVSKATRSDAITFVITLGVGLFLSLQMAIFVGVITSILLFLKKVAEPEMVEHGYTEAGELAEFSEKTKRAEPEVSIVHVEGELFFAAADLFYEQIRRVGEDENLRVLVLKLLHAHHLDASSVLALEELLDYLKEKNCHVLLCEVRRDALRILRDSGVLSRINRKNIFPHTASNPTLSTAKAIKRAKHLISGEPAKVTIYADRRQG
jgi:SulP family sulfate permease